MADVILVALTRPETAATLLDAAWRLASLIGNAAINVLAPRDPIQVSALAAEMLMNEADSVVALQEHEHERIMALKTAFDRWTADSPDGARMAHWIEASGGAAAMIGERGSRADIIVAAQPDEGDRLARQTFNAALFGTGRPVLMVPPGWSSTVIGRCVAIAWRDEKRAVSALIPALRYLTHPEQVHLLMGVREGAEPPTTPRILLEHGIRAELHVLPIGSQPFGQTLLDKTQQLSADLLVMGAYAHSPLRELILGGVTRYMLTHADLPVLMRH